MDTYTPAEFAKDKVLIAKLIQSQRYKEAKELLNMISQIVSDPTRQQANGMLFVLDVLAPSND